MHRQGVALHFESIIYYETTFVKNVWMKPGKRLMSLLGIIWCRFRSELLIQNIVSILGHSLFKLISFTFAKIIQNSTLTFATMQ